MKLQNFLEHRVMSIILLMAVFLPVFNACEEEKPVPRDYPRFTGTTVTNISDSSVTFVSEIFSLGTTPVKDMGFVYSSDVLLEINKNNTVSTGVPEKPGRLISEVRTGIAKNKKYYVRPYAVTEDKIIYGPMAEFTGQGGRMPVITGFLPRYAFWDDTVTVTGKFFSNGRHENKIFIGDNECYVINSSDTCIKFVLSTFVNTIKNLITVEVSGNRVLFTKDTLFLDFPVVEQIIPEKGTWGDSLTLICRKLKNLANYYYRPGFTFSMTLGDKICSKNIKLYPDSIRVKVPDEIDKVSNRFKITIALISVTSTPEFTLLPPPGFVLNPSEGTWGDVITLRGSFHNNPSRNSILIDNYNAAIISSSANEIKCIVPTGVTNVKSRVLYKVTPFTVSSPDSFSLKAPVIKSFAPLSGPSESYVTIKGKYFFPGNTTVRFDYKTAVINQINDSTLVCQVPSGINGECRITVTVKLQTTQADSFFTVTNPVITSVSPLSATFDEEITITGKNFISSYTRVYLGDLMCSFTKENTEKIVFRVPTYGMDSVPRSIKVNSGSNSVTYPENFVLLPHQIFSVTPQEVTPGSEIEITGINFNPVPGLNKVYIDYLSAVVTQASANLLKVTLPQGLPRGNLKIKVITGGYTRYSPVNIINNDSPFLRINAPQLRTKYTDSYYSNSFYWEMANYGKAVNSKGYVASAADNVVYEFNPADNSWVNLNINQPFKAKPTTKMGEVVCNNTLYLISGHRGGSYMYAYNPQENEWKTFNLVNPDPVNVGGVAFAFNNVIYFGLDYSGHSYNKFWRCEPSDGYKWTIIPGMPVTPPPYFSTYFTIGDKGYVIFSNNAVWQCEADNDTLKLNWMRKSDFPGVERKNGISFVINGMAYYGTGHSDFYGSLDDLWQYNPSTDSWSLVCHIPGKRHGAAAFSINNKAYIGFGYDYSTSANLFDFYEFDPARLKK